MRYSWSRKLAAFGRPEGREYTATLLPVMFVE